MANATILAVIVLVCLTVSDAEALECLNCSNISDQTTCNTTAICNAGEVCFQDSIVSGQTKTVTLGCVSNKQCGVASSGPGTLIGQDLNRRQDNKCHECCSTDRCNEILCARRNPATCIDDNTIDCPRLNSVFGICLDINHAKSLCPKFCGLCDVVDGEWTEWTPWSTCDVTCETGTQSRSRTCTNPAPAHNGLDCVGNKVDTQQCNKSLCPAVDGQWSPWGAWGACSVSCDIGLQERQRSCTNPAPQRFGDHCYGVNVDNRICLPAACSNGGWTDWETWGDCSVTCGNGFKSRSRTCTNPRPSITGKYCNGDPFQIDSCNSEACTATNIAFRSNSLTGSHFKSGHTIVFNKTALNEGNGYDNSTGIFTAPVAGTYLFSTQLCVDQGHDLIYAIVVDNLPVKVGHFNDKDWTFCHSADTVVVLSQGSRVSVECRNSYCALLEKEDYSNTFSGVLVHI